MKMKTRGPVIMFSCFSWAHPFLCFVSFLRWFLQLLVPAKVVVSSVSSEIFEDKLVQNWNILQGIISIHRSGCSHIPISWLINSSDLCRSLYAIRVPFKLPSLLSYVFELDEVWRRNETDHSAIPFGKE